MRPRVKEILGVGKVAWEVREEKWDLVVVDSEASGHVVSQIASPRVINRLVPGGPLASQTRWMLEILDDPARTGVVVVSTTEELAVTETVGLIDSLRSETQTALAAVVVNRLDPPVAPAVGAAVEALDIGGLDEAQRSAVSCARDAIARARQGDEAIEVLRSAARDVPVALMAEISVSDEAGNDAGIVKAMSETLAAMWRAG